MVLGARLSRGWVEIFPGCVWFKDNGKGKGKAPCPRSGLPLAWGPVATGRPLAQMSPGLRPPP
jgi:hypothetical protein